MSKYEVFSGSYFSVLGLITGKYGPEISPYLDTFHAVTALPALFFHHMQIGHYVLICKYVDEIR